jgi:hypothetical protein
MFGSRCAYCGCELGDKWHADHVVAVLRKIKYVVGKDGMYRGQTVGFYAPENDHFDNFFPACIPCNIHKADTNLESWRGYLQQQVDIARRNSGPFRHAERFGMITTSDAPIVFYFEKVQGGTN